MTIGMKAVRESASLCVKRFSAQRLEIDPLVIAARVGDTRPAPTQN
jgi:hypothetical protein